LHSVTKVFSGKQIKLAASVPPMTIRIPWKSMKMPQDVVAVPNAQRKTAAAAMIPRMDEKFINCSS
jgi:hypothetical protein